MKKRLIPTITVISIPFITLIPSILSVHEETKNNSENFITKINIEPRRMKTQRDSIELFNTPFLGTELTPADVTSIGWNVKPTITLEDWRTMAPNVISIGIDAFKGSTTLESITIPMSVLTLSQGVFADSSLKQIIFEDGSQLTTINNEAFKNTGIQSIFVPESVEFINGESVFLNTPNLTLIKMKHSLIHVNGTHKWGLTIGQWDAIEWIYTPFLGTTLNFISLRDMGWDKKTQITLEDWRTMAPNTTTIDNGSNGVFQGNQTLTKIDIPKNITGLGQSTFKDTTSLKIINFEPNSSLKWIRSWAFQGSGLETINLPTTLSEVGVGTFTNMLSLTSLSLSSNITKLSEHLVSGSINLENLVLPSKLKIIENNVFAELTKLTKMIVPLTVETIFPDAFASSPFTEIIMPKIFRGDNALKYGLTQTQWDSIEWVNAPFFGNVFNDSILPLIGWETKSIITLEDWRTMAPNVRTLNTAFVDNNHLISIEIPNNIFIFGPNSFKNTNSLKELVFEENSQLKIVEADVFSGSSLKSIKIPNSVILLNKHSLRNTVLNNISMPLKFQDYLDHFGLSDEQWNNINWISSKQNTRFITLTSSLLVVLVIQGIVIFFIVRGIHKLD